MSYFAVCTFDLKNATYDDYQNAYRDLAEIGLYHALTSAQGSKVALPTTTCGGEFNGSSVGAVRDDLTEKVRRAFTAMGFKSEIFVAVGGEWAWGHRTT